MNPCFFGVEFRLRRSWVSVAQLEFEFAATSLRYDRTVVTSFAVCGSREVSERHRLSSAHAPTFGVFNIRVRLIVSSCACGLHAFVRLVRWVLKCSVLAHSSAFHGDLSRFGRRNVCNVRSRTFWACFDVCRSVRHFFLRFKCKYLSPSPLLERICLAEFLHHSHNSCSGSRHVECCGALARLCNPASLNRTAMKSAQSCLVLFRPYNFTAPGSSLRS